VYKKLIQKEEPHRILSTHL